MGGMAGVGGRVYGSGEGVRGGGSWEGSWEGAYANP